MCVPISLRNVQIGTPFAITDGSPSKADDSSNDTDPAQNLITEEMRKEEEKLHRKTMREEEEQKRKALEVG